MVSSERGSLLQNQEHWTHLPKGNISASKPTLSFSLSYCNVPFCFLYFPHFICLVTKAIDENLTLPAIYLHNHLVLEINFGASICFSPSAKRELRYGGGERSVLFQLCMWGSKSSCHPVLDT